MQDTLSEQGPASVAAKTSQQKALIPRSDEGISQEEMLAELNRVILSPDFPATLRNRRFLSFAVERTLEAPAGGFATTLCSRARRHRQLGMRLHD